MKKALAFGYVKAGKIVIIPSTQPDSPQDSQILAKRAAK